MSNIIGLVGFIGSGKGTVAASLVNNYNFRQDSFATSLKDAVACMFDWPRHLLEGDTPESRTWRDQVDQWWGDQLGIENLTPRYVLQFMGTDVLRNHFNNDIWFLTLKNRLRKNPAQSVVISDVRFPNEIKFIQEQGGSIVQINRHETPYWYEIAREANAGNTAQRNCMFEDPELKKVHYSEWAWIGSKIDYTINNISSLKELDNEINKFAKTLL